MLDETQLKRVSAVGSGNSGTTLKRIFCRSILELASNSWLVLKTPSRLVTPSKEFTYNIRETTLVPQVITMRFLFLLNSAL
uniref:Uncharacterized protein n=1 Tax=Tetraselmis sp. GSL018 TaxID=582737 RepID=A0A061RXI4_9CHLO